MKKTYEHPEINVIKVEVERGFAQSLYSTDLNHFYYDYSSGEDEEDDSFLH